MIEKRGIVEKDTTPDHSHEKNASAEELDKQDVAHKLQKKLQDELKHKTQPPPTK